MESFDDIYKTICRICLLRGDRESMVSLIDNKSKDGLSSYGVVVKTFTQITIERDEWLPKTMCAKCLLLLKQAILFKVTCETSEKQLRNMLKNIRSDMEVFKEKIVEYIMYRQIFPRESSVKPSSCDKKSALQDKEEKHDNVISEYYSDYFDNTSFDDTEIEHQNKSKDEEENYQLLEQLEKLVESYTTYIDSDFKRVKRKKRMLKIQPKTINNPKVAKKTVKLICPICEKVMANRHTYDCHMQRHNGFRYICEHCGKGFPILHELQVHQVCKHGTGPFLQCQHCPFKAPRKFDLIEHERLHTGERPFACDKCGLTFRRRGIWKKHLLHHSEKTVQCNQCPRKFYQRSEMLAHCNNVHDRIYMYSCNKCCATYAKTSTVRRHMTEKHGIPREMQGKVLRINKGSNFHEQ